MQRSKFAPCAITLAMLSISNAWGATDADLAEIRNQIRDLKAIYESRIQALEQRLNDAQARAAVPVPAPQPAPSVTSPSAFNPAISAILTGTYARLSRDPSTFAIHGFAPGGEIGPGRRGFGLGESELVLSANVDPHFAGTLIVALTPEDTVAVEEAYGQYLTAPFGLAPKFGRFLSGLGYINEQHPHAWDFVDAPLAYQAFLGGRYANDGVQLKWVAPIDQFLELGVEAGNGDGFPGSARNRNGVGSTVAFAHTGGDVGASHSWRAGVSYLRTRAQEDDVAALSRLGIADFVWKYAPHGNLGETNLKVQGEYFFGRIREASRQSGWYLQGVYQFMPQWRIGARYDRLDPRGEEPFNPRRSSAMLDYNPSEFSRVRLQFARSEPQPGLVDNQWLVQYILSLGAHGAHKY